MNCRVAQEWIHALLDEELPADQWTSLRAHLQDCAACRTMLAQLRAMNGGFRWLAAGSEEVPRPAAPPAVVAFPRRWGLFGAGAAAVAALLVIAVAPWSRMPDTTPTASLAPSADHPIGGGSAAAPFTFRLVGEAHDNYLAVPQTSSRPNVHIVWLYKNRTAPAAQRPQGSRTTADHLLTRS